MKKFTEEELEKSIIELFENENYVHVKGDEIQNRTIDQVLIEDDLRIYLLSRYGDKNITESEIGFILRELKSFSVSDIYGSNKKFMSMLTEGISVPREGVKNEKLFVQLINFEDIDKNIFKIVNQLEIQTSEILRRPDSIVCVNGLPLVVLEFKSAIKEEEATIYDAYKQITVRYARDIPELFFYNAFCVISDGVNTKMGSFFADFEYYYGWRKITGNEKDIAEGISSLKTMISGLFNLERFCDVVHNFIMMPDSNNSDVKFVCRYPQYYASRKLYKSILRAKKPLGDGKGGTYFGSTGCGKSMTMLFLSRLLMRSDELENPTVIIITDRTDLDDQLSELFVDATDYIGDENIVRFESRKDLKSALLARKSGGVFLTTIQKFSEDAGLLTDRENVICISDEAHRSQLNLSKKIVVNEDGVKEKYGFAKFLRDSLPNATFVGLTGTPIDDTLNVFGDIVDKYTMQESVEDGITVDIAYEPRAAKVILDSKKLKDIEKYYTEAEENGANDYQIEESKKQVGSMITILSDPGIIKELAKDFVGHYENRVKEGATIAEKAMFVCATREIAYALFKELISLRPEWNKKKEADDFENLKESEKKELFAIEKVKLVVTRNKDDEKDLYELAGDKEYRKKLDRQFKSDKSNFKIAIIVDMWTTGFDVPSLDTMYIYKPLKRHTLIQTISRVNRKYKDKTKGLVVDYIGIKRNMNLALAHYGGLASKRNIESIEESIKIVKDQLDLLDNMFNGFDNSDYYDKDPLKRLECLNRAAEFVMKTKSFEYRFMELCKRLRSAFNICSGDLNEFTSDEIDSVFFYFAVRSVVYKIVRGEAPDTAQMNKHVTKMVQDALEASGVEEIFGKGKHKEINIFDPVYLDKIMRIKLPHTKIEILKKLISKEIKSFRRINKIKGTDFSERLKKIVEKYNDRSEQDVYDIHVLDGVTDELVELLMDLDKEKKSFEGLGISYEEKAFFDVLIDVSEKYNFEYPEEKMLEISKLVKEEVDAVSKYPAWNEREDIRAGLRAQLMVILSEKQYPPVAIDDAYKEIFEQAENFKKYRVEE